MSAKAYNRGSQAIANQMRQHNRPVEFEIMDNLNAVTKRDNARWIMQTAKISQGNGGFWIACPVTGFGFWHKTMRSLMESWRIVITEYDAIKQEWTVEPMESSAAVSAYIPAVEFMA
jgi:hypothetical protein